jgi:hypothetical protein
MSNPPKKASYTIVDGDEPQVVDPIFSTTPADLFFKKLSISGPNEPLALNPAGKTSFSANQSGYLALEQNIDDLSVIYGKETFNISHEEIQDLLDCQKIHTSAHLPLKFYQSLKNLLKDVDKEDIDKTLSLSFVDQCSGLIEQVLENPKTYGFSSTEDVSRLAQLSLNQIGAMIVKTEDFIPFVDENGKILAREADPNKSDKIRLITAGSIDINNDDDKMLAPQIMEETFKTTLDAAEDGVLLLPAIEMGQPEEHKEIYWKAFLNAVIASDNKLEAIYINPHLQTSLEASEESFKEFLETFKSENPTHAKKLGKVVIFGDEETDLMQTARQLKEKFPDKEISVFNPSSSEVILWDDPPPYEAHPTRINYGALGTSYLLTETRTGVLNDSKRLIAPKTNKALNIPEAIENNDDNTLFYDPDNEEGNEQWV